MGSGDEERGDTPMGFACSFFMANRPGIGQKAAGASIPPSAETGGPADNATESPAGGTPPADFVEATEEGGAASLAVACPDRPSGARARAGTS